MKMSFISKIFLIVTMSGAIYAMDKKNEVSVYHSNYLPTDFAQEMVLKTRKIIDSDETAQQMMERVVRAVFSAEEKFKTSSEEIKKLESEFGSYLDDGYCIFSTSILTNAGRRESKPLSACTVPPIDLRGDIEKVREVIDQLHQDGMGTGFNLDVVEDPVAMLKMLNNIAIDSLKSGKGDRPVACMAILPIDHPRIVEFINAKNNSEVNKQDWKFNISVDINDSFRKAFFDGSDYQLKDGKKISARWLMEQIAKSAHACGEPGIIFLDRLNEDNPTPGVGAYTSVAPCAEVGLAPGESCMFGYINVAKFLSEASVRPPEIDFEKLKAVTRLMVRALDDALELSIDKYAYEEQRQIMKAKRKIGIGICGLADLFIQCGISYCDEQARVLAQDIIAFINYISKRESHKLAEVRGSFEAITLSPGCTYNDNPGFIEKRFGQVSTLHVPGQMWSELAKKIRETKLMRNSSTISLPPTGNSSLLLNASSSIEPLFSLVVGDAINPVLLKALTQAGVMRPALEEKITKLKCIGSLSEIPESIRERFKTIVEIAPEQQLLMLEAIQQVVDESISKTVNTSEEARVEEIVDIFGMAISKRLKGITVYRNNSMTYQPKDLGVKDQ